MPIRQRLLGEKSTFAQRLAHARESRNLSPSDLARAANVTPAAVWNWETNGIHPRHLTLLRVAEILNVTPEYLDKGEKDADSAIGALQGGAPGSTRRSPTVAESMEQARLLIASAAGLPADRVKISVEFL
jgi:transcriptional regulator with XRE-family HTH domain